MNRRGFLGLLGCAAVAPAALVEAMEQPKRTIILPPRGGWPVETIARYTYRTYAVGFSYGEIGARYANALAESLVDAKERLVNDVMNQCFGAGAVPEYSKIEYDLVTGKLKSTPLSREEVLLSMYESNAVFQDPRKSHSGVKRWVDEYLGRF